MGTFAMELWVALLALVGQPSGVGRTGAGSVRPPGAAPNLALQGGSAKAGAAGVDGESGAMPYGMRLPRPAAAAARKSMGFGPPRAAEAVLADLDAIPGRMRSSDDPTEWRAIHQHNDAVKRERIDLISELEESGYTGPRLKELLRLKLADIREVWNRAQFPVSSYDRLRQEMAQRYKDQEIGAEAQAASLLEIIDIININDLRVHPDDVRRLAEVELKRKDSEQAGLLLLEALHGGDDPKDAELRGVWQEWMVQNLGPRSMGRRYVMRERTFGHPIRLEGEGLDGAAVDTSAWAGDVVLVDFWGMWCLPCREAMPELKALREKYAERGLRVVGVLSDYQLEKAKAWLGEKGFAWPQIIDRTVTRERYDQHRIVVQYAIGAFPTLWIIDRAGVLREEGDREHLEEQVKRFLDEAGPAGK